MNTTAPTHSGARTPRDASRAEPVVEAPEWVGPDGSPVTADDVRRACDLFKILSHPDRLRLACAIGDERTTTQKELVEELGWPQSTTARHLAALRQAGLVEGERDGAEVRLRMASPIGLTLMQTVCAWIHDDDAPDPGVGSALGPGLTPSPAPRTVG